MEYVIIKGFLQRN